MIDLETLKSSMPMTLSEFKTEISKQIMTKKRLFVDKWLQSCAFKVEDYREVIEDLVNVNSDLVSSINKNITF